MITMINSSEQDKSSKSTQFSFQPNETHYLTPVSLSSFHFLPSPFIESQLGGF